MRPLLTTCGALAVLAGIALFALAVMTPSQYVPATQALQLIAVYAEGIFKAVLAIVCFSFAGLCLLSLNQGLAEPSPAAQKFTGDEATARQRTPDASNNVPAKAGRQRTPPPGYDQNGWPLEEKQPPRTPTA